MTSLVTTQPNALGAARHKRASLLSCVGEPLERTVPSIHKNRVDQMMQNKPAVYKEVLVGLLVGGLFGPVLGWLIGTFAAFFAVIAMDTENVRSMRGSGFFGGLLGIPLGLATGVIVSLPIRLISVRGLKFLKNLWLASTGALIGWVCGYLILITWYPTFGSVIYVVIVCMVVGGITGDGTFI